MLPALPIDFPDVPRIRGNRGYLIDIMRLRARACRLLLAADKP